MRLRNAEIEAADALGATVIGGPFYGNPLVFAGSAPEFERTDDERRIVADKYSLCLIQINAHGKRLLFAWP